MHTTCPEEVLRNNKTFDKKQYFKVFPVLSNCSSQFWRKFLTGFFGQNCENLGSHSNVNYEFFYVIGDKWSKKFLWTLWMEFLKPCRFFQKSFLFFSQSPETITWKLFFCSLVMNFQNTILSTCKKQFWQPCPKFLPKSRRAFAQKQETH